MRNIDENYYDATFVSFLVKVGIITRPSVNHSDPAIFGLLREDGIKMRLAHLRASNRLLEQEYNSNKCNYMRNGDRWLVCEMNNVAKKIEKVKKAIYFNKKLLEGDNNQQGFDLEALKRIPLTSIMRINPNNFFQENPFRNEKSPSNSLFYYRAINRCTDFGSNKSYDSIDVYCAVNNVSFKEACKEMINL